MDTDLDQACLVWRSALANLIVYGICLYQLSPARQQAQERRLDAPTGRLEKKALRGSSSHCEQDIQAPRKRSASGARALREYKGDAIPKWETVHVGVKLR
eukprot:679935-Pleurochrysis_carterae.AAC.1